ncbi:MAG: hypothetical protein RIT45_1809 [Pseudomonadota bacterium]
MRPSARTRPRAGGSPERWQLATLGLALSCAAAGCVDSAGRGWGEVAVELTAALDLSADRLDAAGRWRSAHGYALGEFSVHLRPTIVRFGAATGASLPFDPASPPPGYSLCHGGHCHADDGSLPSYAEVAAKLAGVDEVAAALTSRALASAALDAPVAVSPVALERCNVDAPCAVEPDGLASGSVRIETIRLRGRLFGATPETRARLGAAGLPLDVSVPVDVEIVSPAQVPVGRHAPFRQRLTLTLRVGGALLDTLPLERWAGATPSDAPREAADDVQAAAAATIHAVSLSVLVNAAVPR